MKCTLASGASAQLACNASIHRISNIAAYVCNFCVFIFYICELLRLPQQTHNLAEVQQLRGYFICREMRSSGEAICFRPQCTTAATTIEQIVLKQFL